MDREADELDQAALATIGEAEMVISEIRASLHGESSTICIDCEQPIPLERLNASRTMGISVQRCVECAAANERWRAMHPRTDP